MSHELAHTLPTRALNPGEQTFKYGSVEIRHDKIIIVQKNWWKVIKEADADLYELLEVLKKKKMQGGAVWNDVIRELGNFVYTDHGNEICNQDNVIDKITELKEWLKKLVPKPKDKMV
jgi:hypothetical protein